MAVSAKIIDSKTREKSDILVNARIEPVQVPVFLPTFEPTPMATTSPEVYREYAHGIVEWVEDNTKLYEYQTVHMVGFYLNSAAEPDGDGSADAPFSDIIKAFLYISCFLRRTCYHYNVVLNVSGKFDYRPDNYRFDFKEKLFIRGVGDAELTFFATEAYTDYMLYCAVLGCKLHFLDKNSTAHFTTIDRCSIDVISYPARLFVDHIYNSTITGPAHTASIPLIQVQTAIAVTFTNIRCNTQGLISLDYPFSVISECVFTASPLRLYSNARPQVVYKCDMSVYNGYSAVDGDLVGVLVNEHFPILYKVHNRDTDYFLRVNGVYLYECSGFGVGDGCFAENSDLICASADFYGIWDCSITALSADSTLRFLGSSKNNHFDFTNHIHDYRYHMIFDFDVPMAWADLNIEFSNNTFDVVSRCPSPNDLMFLLLFGAVPVSHNLVSYNNTYNALLHAERNTYPQESGVSIFPQMKYASFVGGHTTIPTLDFKIQIKDDTVSPNSVVWFMYGTPIKSQSTVSYKYTIPQIQGDWCNEYVYEFSKSNGSDTYVCGTIGSGHSYEFYEDGSYAKHDETWDGKYHTITITEKEIKHDGPDGTVITTETYTEPLCD